MKSSLLASISVLLFLFFTLSGCELFEGEEDTAGVVSGRVVSTETGAPIEGLGVVLRQGSSGFGVYPTVAAVQTGADGVFRIKYDVDTGDFPLSLTINDEPYDRHYAVSRDYLDSGEDLHLGTVELPVNER